MPNPAPARHAPSADLTRILVVEDHPVVRLGIRQMLSSEQDLEICAEADSAEAARQLLVSARPDLAILDLSLAQGTGLDLIGWMRASVPEVRILVLSMHDEALYAERLLHAGARGYIMKREAISNLIEAIRSVLAGRIYVSDAMAQTVLGRLGPDGTLSDNIMAALTDRELQVFELIGRGLSTASIAAQLRVSVKTIETYRSNLRAKLNIKDANDLIRFAATWVERL